MKTAADSTLAPHVGWRARLRLRLEASAGRTILAAREHEGPLVVQRPFYPEGPVCHLYLVHPPGGVAGGDHLSLRIEAGPGAQGVITTPAATKVYRSFGPRVSRIEQELMAEDATLEWLPQENIIFSGAQTQLITRVQLAGRARFIGWEILCLGRPANGERFDAGSLAQDFELWQDGRPLLIDRLRLNGGGDSLDAAWGLNRLPVLGTLLVFPADPTQLALARQSQESAELAATLVDGVLLVRIRAAQSETVRMAFERLWQVLRPGFSGIAARAPRIWAT